MTRFNLAIYTQNQISHTDCFSWLGADKSSRAQRQGHVARAQKFIQVHGHVVNERVGVEQRTSSEEAGHDRGVCRPQIPGGEDPEQNKSPKQPPHRVPQAADFGVHPVAQDRETGQVRVRKVWEV